MDQKLNTMQEFNLSELVTAVAEKSTLNKTVVKEVLQTAFEQMAAALPKAPKQRVEIAGFGVISLKVVKERKGKTSGKIGPVTEWVKPAHYALKFRPNPDFIIEANKNLPADSPLKIAK